VALLCLDELMALLCFDELVALLYLDALVALLCLNEVVALLCLDALVALPCLDELMALLVALLNEVFALLFSIASLISQSSEINILLLLLQHAKVVAKNVLVSTFSISSQLQLQYEPTCFLFYRLSLCLAPLTVLFVFRRRDIDS
jgi:hypothetical protein